MSAYIDGSHTAKLISLLHFVYTNLVCPRLDSVHGGNSGSVSQKPKNSLDFLFLIKPYRRWRQTLCDLFHMDYTTEIDEILRQTRPIFPIPLTLVSVNSSWHTGSRCAANGLGSSRGEETETRCYGSCARVRGGVSSCCTYHSSWRN